MDWGKFSHMTDWDRILRMAQSLGDNPNLFKTFSNLGKLDPKVLSLFTKLEL